MTISRIFVPICFRAHIDQLHLLFPKARTASVEENADASGALMLACLRPLIRGHDQDHIKTLLQLRGSTDLQKNNNQY